ncbi:sensor histidine kinase [Microlunatus speluncae]|uniref:sensor histidine kinase n=1 Tax=Microlunatus speluncae TaxID=2594267 RepID=UPI001375F420|nr:HAMP domain-containing sensor histidine kinase [Microlunatus speluncae]
MALRFRTRLTLMITGLVAFAGLCLLAVEYVIINQLFRLSISADQAQAVEYYPVEPYVTRAQPVTRMAVENELATTVLQGLMPWSVAALIGCTALAAVLSYFLAGRAVGRIAEVTTMARGLSTDDLHRRLSLPGPKDEIKELGDTFDGMLDRLQSAFAAQERFVANASHELRTPLTVSRTALEIPLTQGRVPETMAASVRTALRANQQSERLISALLMLTRGADAAIDAGPEDLSAIVDDAVLDTREAAENAGVTMINRQPPSVIISADQTMIGQAVTNLIDNAITHNQPGGSVWIGSTMIGDRVELRIENTGAVLARQTVELLREPFYRGAESRLSRPNGRVGRNVGLGLSIVDTIVARHGGTLDLSPRDGGGLVAVITLPAVRSAPATKTERAAKPVPGLVTAPT